MLLYCMITCYILALYNTLYIMQFSALATGMVWKFTNTCSTRHKISSTCKQTTYGAIIVMLRRDLLNALYLDTIPA